MGTLRFLLALSVIFAHTGAFFGYRLMGDYNAVQAFFIISGFYMALILNEKYLGPGSFALFIGNRFLRLYPVYWVVLGCAILQAWLLPTHGAWPPNPIASFAAHAPEISLPQRLALAAMNLGIIGQDAVNFVQPTPTGTWQLSTQALTAEAPLWHYLFIPQAWTVSLELCFYLLAPLLVRRRWPVVVLAIAASFALRVYIYKVCHLYRDPFTYRLFPTELALFLLGALSYRLYRSKFMAALTPRVQRAIALGFFVLTFSHQWWPESSLKSWAYYIAVVVAIPPLFTLTKSRSVDRYIGELSYPMYICHLLVISLLQSFFPKVDSVANIIAVTAGTVLLSVLLLHFVQEPIERLRARRVRKFHVEAPAA